MDVKDRRTLVRAAPGLSGKLSRGVWHRLVLGTISAPVERGLDHHGAADNHYDMLLLHSQKDVVPTSCRGDANCAIISNVDREDPPTLSNRRLRKPWFSSTL